MGRQESEVQESKRGLGQLILENRLNSDLVLIPDS